MKGAANYVQVAPRKLVGYEGNDRVEKEVSKRGGEVITFPGSELIVRLLDRRELSADYRWQP
ncbi:MAG: hypothetical protein HY762_00755 [Planctomycetes bacterium]|nr:hypothetical protein [Planctomycetota bacterium]